MPKYEKSALFKSFSYTIDKHVLVSSIGLLFKKQDLLYSFLHLQIKAS